MSKLNRQILQTLLFDRTTRKNLIWGTGEYENLGTEFEAKKEITFKAITGQYADLIRPRIRKSDETQLKRTRKHAEVFTPSWICNFQNNVVDKEWFGRENVFNVAEGQRWVATKESISFPIGRNWKDYVDSRRLEITCGEAPYLTSRYDAVTGCDIEVSERIGLLDRKLRIINENAETEAEWIKWTVRAYQSSYGYEYQGDNILIARINLVLAFIENMKYRWERKPDLNELLKISWIVSWNIWQMDGLSDKVPLGIPEEKYHQMELFDIPDIVESPKANTQPLCRIMDWRSKKNIVFSSLKENRKK